MTTIIGRPDPKRPERLHLACLDRQGAERGFGWVEPRGTHWQTHQGHCQPSREAAIQLLARVMCLEGPYHLEVLGPRKFPTQGNPGRKRRRIAGRL